MRLQGVVGFADVTVLSSAFSHDHPLPLRQQDQAHMAVASRLLLRGSGPSPPPIARWTALLLSIPHSISVSGGQRGFTSTRPCGKGRKGGSSILRPNPPRSTKIPGAGKKKKPKVYMSLSLSHPCGFVTSCSSRLIH